MNPNWDALTPTSLEWLTRLAPSTQSTQSTQHRPRRGFCGFLILGEGRDVAVEIGDHISGSLSERGQEMTRGPGWDKIGVEEQFFRKLEFHDGRNQVPIFEVPQENHDGTTRKFICFLMGESV